MEPKLFSKQPALRSFSPGTIILLATAILILSCATAAHAQTVINSTTCNSSDFAAALSQGGRITFANDCTISTIFGFTVATNLTLDGTGHKVILNGGNTNYTVLSVNSGITLVASPPQVPKTATRTSASAHSLRTASSHQTPMATPSTTSHWNHRLRNDHRE